MALHLKKRHGIDINSKTSKTSETSSSSSVLSDKDSSSSSNTCTPSHAVKPQGHGQLSIAQAFQTKMAPGSARAQLITRNISLFIATDLRPFSLVDSKAFRNLLNTLEPKYNLPTRATFSRKEIPALCREVYAQVQSILNEAETVALTTDGWTSRATESYITITSHFIDKSWKLQNKVLQTQPMHESHTGVNIATVLKEAVGEWHLERPHGVQPLSSDGAANMALGVQLANMKPHIKCFAHTINLAAQKVLKINEVHRLLGRVKRIVTFFSQKYNSKSPAKTKARTVTVTEASTVDLGENPLEQCIRHVGALSRTTASYNGRTHVSGAVTRCRPGHADYY
ncbi:zinc finger BED domain-containing protein 4-like [Gigantopelta aegis]|uniref:zinc finger BED domain-containing protein 4-like n=1 Tax=Gigantopelta aegis TaxID=1735272 RepID=UPI001B88DD6A|nr:zinc finger BED domain-containing protein 4-like [Gigantopelta aegis]